MAILLYICSYSRSNSYSGSHYTYSRTRIINLIVEIMQWRDSVNSCFFKLSR
jgi:hypothetical protein